MRTLPLLARLLRSKLLPVAAAALTVTTFGRDARAEDFPALGTLQVAVVQDMHQVETFDIPALDTRNCTTTSADVIKVVKCEVAGAPRLVLRGANGDEQTVSLSRFMYVWKQSSVATYHEHHFFGEWTHDAGGI